MTTILSTKGQIVIPGEIRERKGLRPGDELEIEEDRDAIVIRKKRRNEGLIAHLRACPVKSFKAPRMSGHLRSAKF
jgi:AbrB family looped-hinge helix DNA binding protein